MSKIEEHLKICDEGIIEGGELYKTAKSAEEISAARDTIDYWIKQRGYLIDQLKTENDIQISEYDKLMKKQDALVNIFKAMPVGVVIGEIFKQNRFVSAIMNEREGYIISRQADKYI